MLPNLCFQIIFLQFNLTFPSSFTGKLERVIGFGSPALFQCIGGNQKVFINGTFKIVPKPFYQCLIVMVFDNQTDVYVSVFYILLTSKTEKIICDFEKGLHNANLEAFPKAIINGCLFHWKQAI